MTSDNQLPPDGGAGLEGDSDMSELENAEQYVRAHELIERLRAQRRPAREGDEQDARLSATAALLHAAAPDSATVDPLFAARLFERMQSAQTLQSTQRQRVPADSAEPVAARGETPPNTSAAPPAPRARRGGVSRRGLLWGGLGAAAAAVAGAAVTNALEQPAAHTPPSQPPLVALSPEGAGAWVSVAAVAAVPLGAIKRFEAGAIIGYLQHTTSGFLALSGVCTHMACLLQWNSADHTFDCPCHGGRFLSNGQSAPGGRYTYAPLPAIQTKVEGEQVFVYVAGASASPAPAGATSGAAGGYQDATTP